MQFFQQILLAAQYLVTSPPVGDECPLPRTLPDPLNTIVGTCLEETDCVGRFITPGLCHGADSIKCCTDIFAPDHGLASAPPTASLSDFGATFIHGSEGFRANFYCDQTRAAPRGGGRHCETDEGTLTVGWGHACKQESACAPDKIRVPMTRAEGDALFQRDVAARVRVMNSLLKPETILTQNQFDALVSFQFNTNAFSRIATMINDNEFEQATAKMKEFNKSGNPLRLDQRLVQRRGLEVNLFNS